MREEEQPYVDPYDVHELLANPQRVFILRALRQKGEMTFTELMKHVDLPSGRLAFQLLKLESLLIKTEEKKYRLSPIGFDSLQVVDFSEALLRFPDEHAYRNVIVRKASLDDAGAIADVDRSWHDKWYKFKGKMFEVSLKDLNREEIEMQGGAFDSIEGVREYLTKTHNGSTGREGPLYVAILDEKVVGYLVFWLGCVSEPEPWGKRAPFSINLHKKHVDLDTAKALIHTCLEIGRKLKADRVELMTIPTFRQKVLSVLEKALEEYSNVIKVEFSRLRACVDDVPLKHQAIIRGADFDAALSRKLFRNRSLTYAVRPSSWLMKEYPLEHEEKLIRIGDKACTLELFKEEPYLDEVDLELHCEPNDWTDKNFIQEAIKASVATAKQLGNKKVVVLTKKQLESWFKELGFTEWKPETEYEEKLVGGRSATPNYLLKVSA